MGGATHRGEGLTCSQELCGAANNGRGYTQVRGRGWPAVSCAEGVELLIVGGATHR